MKKSYQPTIALAMIVRGVDSEAPLLARCLASINGYVDAIYLNINHREGESVSQKVRMVAEQYTDKIYTSEWHDNFVQTRNDIFKKVPKKSYDWLLWLDADDTVWQPQKIRNIIAIAPQDVHGIFAQYDYDHDEYGNCTVTHRIARLVRNDGTFTWQASFKDEIVTVHEILSETRSVKKAYSNEFKVIHHATTEKRRESLLRNINLLQGMYARQAAKKQVDPRILYYLGRELFNSGELFQAEPFLVEYLKASGWAEERAEAWLHLGIIFENQERPDSARQAYGRAFLENPKSPRPLVELGKLEFHEKRYQMSEEFLLMAIDKKVPQTAYAVFPMENKYRAYMLLVQTYINMGFSRIREAEAYVTKALKLRPTDATAKEAQDLVAKLMKVRQRTQAITRLAAMYKEEDRPEDILKVLDTLPLDFQDNPAVITLRQKYQKPVKWPKKSIAIFCGNSAEDIWGPWSLEGGMGGSEEAVVQLSSEMAELGWQVTVYGTPGSRAGFYYGDQEWGTREIISPGINYKTSPKYAVEWKQYWEFNPKDVFDVFIAWRMPWWFDINVRARKRYLWLHDVMDKSEFTKERLNNLEKVIFVSQYHANLYKNVIPEDKWFVSGNGIDPEQFEKYDDIERDAHRCLYMSSQVRGLDILCDIWPRVLEEVPDATCVSYYGWKTYDNSNKDNPERMEWKNKIIRKMKEVGIIDGGRIGHDEIAREIQSSGILAYPCTFPEVNCITVQKSLAGGCCPVISDFGCLPMYKDLTTQVHLTKNKEAFKKQYAKMLIKYLKDPVSGAQRKVTAEKARYLYSWSRTAAGWDKEFK